MSRTFMWSCLIVVLLKVALTCSRSIDMTDHRRCAHTLKGHCHAIWQLKKKLEGVFASIEFQN